MAQLKDTDIHGDLNVDGKIGGGMCDVGDVIALTIACGGYITASGTQFNITAPIPPVTSRVTGFKLQSATATIRQNGNYLIGSSSASADMLTGGTYEGFMCPGSVRVRFARNSAPANTSNNDGFGAVVNLTIEFT